MLAPTEVPTLEHLTPHDLVSYFRCPYEMELHRAARASGPGATPIVRTPERVVPLRHSPLFAPPLGRVVVNEGRMDVGPSDSLVYRDDGEDDLPMLFAPEQVQLDPRFARAPGTLSDPELGFAGRPDLVIRRADGSLEPVEYKATHLFVGYHEAHGRAFDTVQAIAECRLVQAAFGRRPAHGLILYGDAAGGGQREGWVEIAYGDAEERWLRAALAQIRSDGERAPVPAERNCGGCEPNGEGLCRFAAARYEGPHHRLRSLAAPTLAPPTR